MKRFLILGISIIALATAWWFFPYKHRARAYLRNGRYVGSFWYSQYDCEPGIDRCRAFVQALGGGECKVIPGTLRVKNRSVIGSDYPNAKITIEVIE